MSLPDLTKIPDDGVYEFSYNGVIFTLEKHALCKGYFTVKIKSVNGNLKNGLGCAHDTASLQECLEAFII